VESDNKTKSIIDAYLSENKDEAKKAVYLDSTSGHPATSGKRIGGAIIDKLILFAVSTYVLSPMIKPTQGFNMVPFFINVLAEFLYSGYFYSSHLATPGKMIFGIQVIKDSGAKLEFLEAGLRDSVGKFVSSVILGIGYLMAFFRSDRRALHDLMFKTRVVEKK
jgi:uncharacterized RDD family membrane protein YckC